MFLTLIATALSYGSASEYVTLFRDAQGAAKFHVLHEELAVEGRKTTLLNVDDKKAWLLEDTASGNLTLVIGEEAYTAPAAKDKEPVTSLSYFAKVYANAAAPKPKKKGLLDGLGKNVLGLTGLLTGSLFSSAFTNSLGSMSSQMVASTALTTLQGFAVREMTQSLGRATSYTAMTEGDNPTVVRELTKVDKNTMVETVLLRKLEMNESAIPKPASPKSVTASEMYEIFSKFLGSGIEKES